MFKRKLLGAGVIAGVASALLLATPAQAVPATIPAGGLSVASLTPAAGQLVLTPTFGGVVCPADATQVAGAFYGGTGTGEILESDPALGSAYVIGEPSRLEFSIERLAGQKGVATANLAGTYAYRLTCVNDFGVPIDGATVYYALVAVTPTGYTFQAPGGTPTTAPTATTTTAPTATTTTAPTATTTTAPTATTTTGPTTAPTATTTTGPTATTTTTTTTTTTPPPAGPFATSSTLASVTPNSGPEFQAVTLTGTVANTTAPATVPVGTCAFKNGTVAIATVTVSPTGTCAYTASSFGAGTYAFSFDFVPGNANFLASTSNSLPATYTPGGAPVDPRADPQTVIVTVPAGNLSINTPYTPANPFNLGTLVLADNGSSYSVSAPFGSATTPDDGVAIVDTRAGALPFTAQLASAGFTNDAATISSSLLGFTGVTPAYVTGNAINAATKPVTVTDLPAGSISITPATFASGTGPGTVNIFGNLSLSNVPTSTAPGLYTATITFTIS